MRWDYDPPDPQTIVGDGETLWIYQPDLKQVIKAPLGAGVPVEHAGQLPRRARAASIATSTPP